MKKIVCVIIGAIIMMAFSCMSVFAEEDQGDCEHQWGEWQVIKKSTCQEQGYKARECELCHLEQKELLPLGSHSWSSWSISNYPSCSHPGEKTRKCYTCRKIEYAEIPPNEHEWTPWETLRKNSPYHKGEKYRECEICLKEEYKTTPIREATAQERASMKRVKRFFSAAKTYNTPRMVKCFAQCSKGYFAHKNSLLAKWSRKYNKRKMSWKIKDVQTYGKYVKVKIRVTYANGYNAFFWGSGKWYEWYCDHSSVSNSYAESKWISILKSEIKKRGMKKSHKTINLKCKHTSKGWKIIKPNRTLKEIVGCRYYEAMDDFEDIYY